MDSTTARIQQAQAYGMGCRQILGCLFWLAVGALLLLAVGGGATYAIKGIFGH